MTIASDLLERHIADPAQWQTLIADDMVWELANAPAIGYPECGRSTGVVLADLCYRRGI